MIVELTAEEVSTLKDSLVYSKQRIADAADTPYSVRQENLRRVDDLLNKLRRDRNTECTE